VKHPFLARVRIVAELRSASKHGCHAIRSCRRRARGFITAGSPIRKYVDLFAWGEQVGQMAALLGGGLPGPMAPRGAGPLWTRGSALMLRRPLCQDEIRAFSLCHGG
jgi:hypothetical protein